MTTTSSGKTPESGLQYVCHLLEEFISDNGSQFISEDFQTFLWQNSVKRARSATCHPASNGLAECFVQSLR